MSFSNNPLVAVLVVTLAGAPQAAMGQEAQPIAQVLAETHVHGLAPRAGDVLMATHHGLWTVDLERETAQPLGESRDDFMGFLAHPTDTTRYWASGHPVGGGNLGVIESTTGGESWSAVAEGVGGPVDFHQMTVSPANPDVLYGVHHGTSLQKSEDGGRNWEEIGLLPDGVIDLAASAVASETLFAATNTGLFKSEDEGRTWIRIHESSSPVSSVQVDEAGVLAFVLGVGVVRAEEEDLVFSVIADGFGGTYLLHLTAMEDGFVALTDKNALLVLSAEGEMVKSIS